MQTTTASSRTPVRYAALALALGGAVTEAVVDGGGFGAGSRLIFAGLAVAALVAAGACDRPAAAQAARRPVVTVLWLLGVLGALSAAWTTGARGAALRWGLVTIGYGAVVVASCVVSRHRYGGTGIALLIASLALGSGIVGLYGAGAFVEPVANHTTGFWRPAGTLGYSSALSLLEVSALPAVLRGMAHRRRAVAAVAAFAGAVAAVVLSLGQTRLECALAILVCALALARPRRTIRSTRRLAAAAIALLAVVGVGAYIVAGRKVSYTARPHELARLSGIAAICLAAMAVWTLGRAPQLRRRARLAAICAVVTVAVAAVALTAIKGDTSHTVYVQNGGFFHGRLGIWKAAFSTATHRILWGHGADSDLISTPVPLPGEAIVDAHDLPLELAVELGIPGFALALALYWTALKGVWRSRRRADAWLFAPAAAGFLLADLLDWEWHLAGSGSVWALALGALILPSTRGPSDRPGGDDRGPPPQTQEREDRDERDERAPSAAPTAS